MNTPKIIISSILLLALLGCTSTPPNMHVTVAPVCPWWNFLFGNEKSQNDKQVLSDGKEGEVTDDIPSMHLPTSSQESAYYSMMVMPLDYTLKEIKTKRWIDKGKTVQLLKSKFFITKDENKPNIIIFIYGNVDSDNIRSIEFYGTMLDEINNDNLTLKLLRHNSFNEVIANVDISMKKQENRLFFILKTTITDSPQKKTMTESYELNDSWQLVRGMSTFIHTPSNPTKP
jgi:hypothetical protein